MTDGNEGLKKYQTDHLILLVGTNPLPNYVAARLLCPEGQVHLLCSRKTEDIAERLKSELEANGIDVKTPLPLTDMTPAGIYNETVKLARPLGGSVGLNYTGGTKAMSVQAYRAVQECHPRAVFTYLDARTLSMLVDDPDQIQDANIGISNGISVTVQTLGRLHNLTFKMPIKSQPIALSVAQAVQATLEVDLLGEHWREWWTQIRWDTDNLDAKKANVLLSTELPSEFGGVRNAFAAISAPANYTLESLALLIGFGVTKKNIVSFAKWLEGEWLESTVLQHLLDCQTACDLHDIGMDYKVQEEGEDKLQFDVAATRGYQLFAISCTTSDENDLCKSKLFEAYVRARQIGGDEARTALVCYHNKPEKLLKKFESSNFVETGSIAVFGKPDLPELKARLKQWINTGRG